MSDRDVMDVLVHGLLGKRTVRTRSLHCRLCRTLFGFAQRTNTAVFFWCIVTICRRTQPPFWTPRWRWAAACVSTFWRVARCVSLITTLSRRCLPGSAFCLHALAELTRSGRRTCASGLVRWGRLCRGPRFCWVSKRGGLGRYYLDVHWFFWRPSLPGEARPSRGYLALNVSLGGAQSLLPMPSCCAPIAVRGLFPLRSCVWIVSAAIWDGYFGW